MKCPRCQGEDFGKKTVLTSSDSVACCDHCGYCGTPVPEKQWIWEAHYAPKPSPNVSQEQLRETEERVKQRVRDLENEIKTKDWDEWWRGFYVGSEPLESVMRQLNEILLKSQMEHDRMRSKQWSFLGEDPTERKDGT